MWKNSGHRQEWRVWVRLSFRYGFDSGAGWATSVARTKSGGRLIQGRDTGLRVGNRDKSVSYYNETNAILFGPGVSGVRELRLRAGHQGANRGARAREL